MEELIEIECEKCSEKFSLKVNWRNAEIVETQEREMGCEIVHRCIIDEDNFKCPNCGCKINEVYVYEYPEGGFNYAIGNEYEI